MSDARVRYTKDTIRRYFLKLLKTTPIHRITVKKICELAEINRSTFYRYYRDPYDILEQLETEIINEFTKIVNSINSRNFEERMLFIMKHLKENMTYYSIMFSENGNQAFISKMMDISLQLTKERYQVKGNKVFSKDQEKLFYFFSRGCKGVIEYWICQDMKEEPQEIVDYLLDLYKRHKDNF